MKTIVFTVTNDLTYDQRMQRICGSLAASGYSVLLIGYKLKSSIPLSATSYRQKRINCLFKKGKLFYLEYNFRLFFYLLFQKIDCICAIDLDTIIPCWFISKIKSSKRVYDAHEYFTQLDEVISRPFIHACWRWVERTFIPRFKKGYTVCQSLAQEFRKNFNADYEVIRNVPVLIELPAVSKQNNILIYQGAVNQGRGLDKLVAAMKNVEAILWVCGDGNFMTEMKAAVAEHKVSNKIIFWGMLDPVELKKKSTSAYIAINPFERTGLNQYLSLSNKFFDYIHSALPQVTMNYPEYSAVNKELEIAVLIDDLEPESISKAVNNLLANTDLYDQLRKNCMLARENHNWQKEEKKLIAFYKKIFDEQ